MRGLTASLGEMRPSGTTAVASMQMAPTPRVAKPYRVIRRHVPPCQRVDSTDPDVDQMPVCGVAVVRAVLAHGRLHGVQRSMTSALVILLRQLLTTQMRFLKVIPRRVSGWNSMGKSLF